MTNPKKINNQFGSFLKKIISDIKSSSFRNIFLWVLPIILGLILPTYLPPDTHVYIIVALMVFFLLTIAHFISKQFKRKVIKISAYVIALVFCLFIHTVIQKDSLSNVARRCGPCDNPVTLHDHFECDFTSPLGISIWSHVNFFALKDTIGVPYESLLYQDFNAQSCFLGLYIPETPLVYGVCEYLSHYCDSILAELRTSALDLGLHKPGEKTIYVKNLKFSRAVYIYHETPMETDQTDSLITLYKANDINPEFHSNDYFVSPDYHSFK